MINKFYTGVVVDRDDPLMLGRCRVRIIGLHSAMEADLPNSDLPWAFPIQSSNSAANSGIGWSPTGLIEGTWCIIIFADENEQVPLILGTVGGQIDLNTNKSPKETPTPTASSDSTAASSASTGEPIPPAVKETPTTEAPVSAGGTDIVSVISSDRANATVTVKLADGSIVMRKPGNGGGTIAWRGNNPGNLRASSLAVGKMDTKNGTFAVFANEAKGKEGLKQLLFSSSRYRGKTLSQVISIYAPSSENNTDAYKAKIAAAFDGRDPNIDSLATDSEKDKLMNVIMKVEGWKPGLIVPVDEKVAEAPTTSSPPPNVVDGPPIVVPSPPAAPVAEGKWLFKDPNDVYPPEDMQGECDTNRLARAEKIEKTCMQDKADAQKKNIPIANSAKLWNQQCPPYHALYPFNHVYESECGHILEFDDTKDHERVHLYHTTGTFMEIDKDGNQTDHVVGAKTIVVEKDAFVYIIGGGHVCLDGDLSVVVHGQCQIQVQGDASIKVKGDMYHEVGGDYNIRVGGEYKVLAGGNVSVKASNTAIDGGNINLNSGAASSADPAPEYSPEMEVHFAAEDRLYLPPTTAKFNDKQQADYIKNPTKYTVQPTPSMDGAVVKEADTPPPANPTATPTNTGSKCSFAGGNQGGKISSNNPKGSSVTISFPNYDILTNKSPYGYIVRAVRPVGAAGVLPTIQKALSESASWSRQGSDPGCPKLVAMWKELGMAGLAKESTAWCAGFVNWSLKQAGLQWTVDAGAVSTMNSLIKKGATEVAIKDIQPGDVCLWKLGNGNHVNFCYTRSSQ